MAKTKKDLSDITKDMKTEDTTEEKELTMEEILHYKETISAQMYEMDLADREAQEARSAGYYEFEMKHRSTQLALQAISTIGALLPAASSLAADTLTFQKAVQEKLIELLALIKIEGEPDEDN